MIKIPHQPQQMYHRRTQHRNMHDLMTPPKQIKRPPPKPLGKLRRVRRRPGAIECQHAEQVVQADAVILGLPAVEEDAVDDGDEGGEDKAGEEAGAQGLGARVAEGGGEGEDGGAGAEDGELWGEMGVSCGVLAWVG
jgi:hypothetical protein